MKLKLSLILILILILQSCNNNTVNNKNVEKVNTEDNYDDFFLVKDVYHNINFIIEAIDSYLKSNKEPIYDKIDSLQSVESTALKGNIKIYENQMSFNLIDSLVLDNRDIKHIHNVLNLDDNLLVAQLILGKNKGLGNIINYKHENLDYFEFLDKATSVAKSAFTFYGNEYTTTIQLAKYKSVEKMEGGYNVCIVEFWGEFYLMRFLCKMPTSSDKVEL